MKTWFLRLVVLVYTMASVSAVFAQYDPNKVCRYVDGRLVFTLDKRWTASQRREVARMFNLDSTILKGAFALKPAMKDSCYAWKTRQLDANRVELIGEPCKDAEMEVSKDKILLLDDQLVNLSATPAGDRESVPFGVNRLTRNTIVQLAPGKIRFFLPDHKTARQVYISGSFNGWSTMQTPLQRCDSGWTATLNLQPGKYAYKFIVDGKWVNDSYNKLRELDTYHGYNNIFFCYNYKFVLKGYPNARVVYLCASFNDWKESDLRMIHFQGNWVLPLFLREGTHAYKFRVDREWITDPANKVTRPDGRGNLNSFMGIGDTLFFTLKGYPVAKKVVLSGNFNGWNSAELEMTKTRGGWQLPYVLRPGGYEYKFIVDGEWITDPTNPYSVGEGQGTNSYLAVKPNHWFRLDQHSDADHVIVTGSFNNWNKNNYRMDLRQGTWWFPIYLKPGKYTYKFRVDNKWIIDPANKLWEDNEYGTGNSVLWIEP